MTALGLIILAATLLQTAPDRAPAVSVLSSRITDEVGTFERWKASDPADGRGLVLVLRFEPTLTDLSISDLTISWNRDGVKQQSSCYGATLTSSATNEGIWFLQHLKDGQGFKFTTGVTYTSALFGLPNDVRTVTVEFRKEAVVKDYEVKR